ncbi:cytochrome c oxidase assembly protein [Paenibacillus sambharensis]|uniref:Cytochrome c oxidase assembly protein n=2 Tax=Paenibacillus sambharensis TaxID=1803190 RepID=A0A2W1L7C8_9BACL|nr:cytochrome c oxidase assembly protein [Paenibacillus sambharensis]PZD94050.1 cytochrome c oxidase assembly protein [Paenibacillus sambharensis]
MNHSNHYSSERMAAHEYLPSALPFVLLILLYAAAAILSSRRYGRTWPLSRFTLWLLGILAAAAAVIGPLAEQAHRNFEAHMAAHLLLGMLAPLLLVLSAPLTLALRVFNTGTSRRISRILKGSYFRFLSHPVTASILNIGGLWLLYCTSIYSLMQDYLLVHLIVHVHIFLSGYVFTASMIYIDPTPHRTGYILRTVVMVTALAGHGILAKYLYANPPAGVPAAQAEAGSLLMYYGGDGIHIILILLLCLQWYRSARPRVVCGKKTSRIALGDQEVV